MFQIIFSRSTPALSVPELLHHIATRRPCVVGATARALPPLVISCTTACRRSRRRHRRRRIDHDDLRAFLSQHQGGFPADAASAAHHNCRFTVIAFFSKTCR
jgi:hypothetical protein